MLLRLSSNQVQAYWQDIKEALLASVPPLATATPSSVNQIMENILLGKMQTWALYEQKGTEEQPSVLIHALLITQEWVEPGSFTKNLLIYALYGYSFVPPPVWQDGLRLLRDWARSRKCHSIVAFTKVPRVVELVKSLGGDVSTTFLQLEV